jgi:hypothetical protein
MARNPSNVSAALPRKPAKRTRASIPEPFHVVTSATVARKAATIEVPMLVLYGEWLKAAGFPIGAAAYLTADRRGELALSRVGLGFPRRLRIRATPR